jgi:metal-sulfur cluster biosynthetic enzyme
MQGMSEGPLAITRLLEHGSDADQVRELLREVPDPELGVDIVSLGLVYGVEVNGRTAAVLATTTTPACPLGDYITSEIERVLLASGIVDRVEVELTYSPPWTPQLMDDATKRAFGWS